MVGSASLTAVLCAVLWILRDFTLTLKDKHGHVVTEREYLESCLKREIGFDDDIAARNRIRLLLTTFFKRRDCVGLQRPVIDEGELARLATGAAALRDVFSGQIAALKAKVTALVHPDPA
jgi:hypothetical protein